MVFIPIYMYLTNKTEENLDPTLNITIYSIKDMKLGTNETKPLVLADVLTYSIF